MRILLCKSDLLPDLEGVSGILQIAPHSDTIRDYIKRLSSRIPIVSVLGSWPGVPAVVADEQGGVFSAVGYLLTLRHRRIAMLASRIYGPATRIDAYRNRLLQTGITPREEWVRIMAEPVPGIPFEELGYLSMKEWLKSGWSELGCTALLCQNDDTAVGVLRALREVGIRVPEGVSLVGFDGTQVASYLRPSLTTIEMPLRAMITRAWELLRAHAHPLPSERPSPEIVMLPTKLRVAQSTAAPNQIESQREKT
jgi:DNA-binding LacI/PurR family transcriptional regulator